MVSLDATAGYQTLWPVKNMPNWVYMDKRAIKGNTLIATWRYLPFRDNVFDVILMDPPHLVERGGNLEYIEKLRRVYTFWQRKRNITPAIYYALKEFHRVGKKILIFKWCDDKVTIWQLYAVFKGLWFEYSRVTKNSRSGMSNALTYWITFFKIPSVSKNNEH